MSKVYLALKKAEKEKTAKKTSRREDLPEVSTDKEETRAEKPPFPAERKSRDHFEPPDESSLDQHLVTFLSPKSVAAEQFRKLRTLILGRSNGNLPRCLLITSSVLNDGKTMTAINLAIAIAQGVHEHVLLIDADLRKPSIHKYLGLNHSSGLSDYLTGDIELSRLLIKTPVPGLTLLPAGPVSDKASELFSSNKMRSLINEVKSRYEDRYIVIDSTPIMSTSESDILSRQVEGIIFVVRAGKTPREAIQRSLLNLDKEKILGVVLNDVEFQTIGYKYGYYRYYNYYGKEEKR